MCLRSVKSPLPFTKSVLAMTVEEWPPGRSQPPTVLIPPTQRAEVVDSGEIRFEIDGARGHPACGRFFQLSDV